MMSRPSENTSQNGKPLPHPAIGPFLDSLAGEQRSSKHTVIAYRNDLIDFFHYLMFEEYEKQDTNGNTVKYTNGYGFGEIGLKDIRSEYIRSWLATMKNEEGYLPRSLNRKMSSLKSFFKYHLTMGNIDKLPMERVVSQKLPKRLPVHLTENTTEELFNNLQTITESLANRKQRTAEGDQAGKPFLPAWGERTAELVLVILYLTGIRRDELINLKCGNIDRNRRTIKVTGKGNKERQIPVPEQLIRAMLDYDAAKIICLPVSVRESAKYKGNEWLLIREDGRTLSPAIVYNNVKKYLGEVTSQQKKSPHVLRHTFATQLTYHGADINAVKNLLGHASLAATQVYTHTSIEMLKEIHKKSHPKA